MRDVIRQKILDGIHAEIPSLTPRDVHLPQVAGKAIAVVGMRRVGSILQPVLDWFLQREDSP